VVDVLLSEVDVLLLEESVVLSSSPPELVTATTAPAAAIASIRAVPVSTFESASCSQPFVKKINNINRIILKFIFIYTIYRNEVGMRKHYLS